MSTSTQKNRRSGRPKDLSLDARVLDAVWELLADKPLSSLTMHSIADAANTSRPALYRRWNKVEDIVIEAFLTKSQDAVPLPDANDATVALYLYIQSLVRFIGSPVGRVLAELLGSAQTDPELLERFHNGFLYSRRAHGQSLIQRGQRQGYFRADLDLELTLDLFAGPIYYRAFVRHAPLDDDFAVGLSEQVLKVISTDQETTT